MPHFISQNCALIPHFLSCKITWHNLNDCWQLYLYFHMKKCWENSQQNTITGKSLPPSREMEIFLGLPMGLIKKCILFLKEHKEEYYFSQSSSYFSNVNRMLLTLYLQHFQWELKKVGWKYFWRIMKRKPPEIRHILDNIIKKQKTTKPHKTEVHILLWNRTEFWVSHQRNSSQPWHLQIQISPKAEGV